MGLLRLILALCVVCEHIGAKFFGQALAPGPLAVRAFYVISGSYIALVLGDKYAGALGAYKLFLGNRILKLLPLYLVLLVVHLAVCIAGRVTSGNGQALDAFIEVGPRLTALALSFTALATLFLFGLDWFFFLGHDAAGELVFVPNFATADKSLVRFSSV